MSLLPIRDEEDVRFRFRCVDGETGIDELEDNEIEDEAEDVATDDVTWCSWEESCPSHAVIFCSCISY